MNLEKGRKLVEFGKEVMCKLELDEGLRLVENLAHGIKRGKEDWFILISIRTYD